jgi:hypothetical protein
MTKRQAPGALARIRADTLGMVTVMNKRETLQHVCWVAHRGLAEHQSIAR